MSEVDRLRLENIALSSKVRELEETVAKCLRAGLKLNAIIAAYERGEEPTPAELNAAAQRD